MKATNFHFYDKFQGENSEIILKFSPVKPAHLNSPDMVNKNK